ncbi:diguanylate cyclase [Shewanella abyssi]|uniref:sensor domain-containing diguanylate cyclase n=1 Tax=Shewanella abyssi TaxID=311789 RepID=UPI00200E3019|nr:diguanylate cyclase [Shewanella abyssi]MCL1048539.1 diguanylate cyclase [Shewanella abyssi]
MKALSFNQLQVRVFALIVVVFTSVVFSYRVWVQIPQLEHTMIKLSERETSSLIFGLERMNKPMITLNYDYAVWNETYEFVLQPSSAHSQQYLHENFLNDTFVRLEIDAVFIFDSQSTLLYSKGYHHKTQQELRFDLYRFDKYPENKILTATPYNGTKVMPKTGVISTLSGAAFYSSTPILVSDKSLPSNGFLVFIRLIDQEFIDEISLFTATPVTMEPIDSKSEIEGIKDLDAEIKLTKIVPFSQRIIRNTKGEPSIKVTVYHSNSKPPSIWGMGLLSLVFAMIVLLVTVYLLLAGFIIRPVQRLAKNVKAMDKRQRYKQLPKNYIIAELRNISFHFNALMLTVQRQNTLLSQQVYVDELTQIANRRAFELHLESQVQLLRRQNIGFTLILADIDYFKQYNDTLGHVKGDETLKAVATLLEQHFKRAEDMCARFGGEEFIMIYSDIPFAALERKLLEILDSLQTLALPHPSSDVADHVSVSFGVCQVFPIPTASDNADSCITGKQITEMADKALYQAKENGRNQYYKVTITANELPLTNED